MTVVFVYGTLTDPDQVSTVVDQYTLGPPAVCEGLQRLDGQYPTLAPGGRTDGRLLATPELALLDSYEGLDRGLYCRVSVPLSTDGPTTTTTSPFSAETAEVYVGRQRLLGVETPVGWPGAGGFEQRVQRYVDSHSVRVKTNSH